MTDGPVRSWRAYLERIDSEGALQELARTFSLERVLRGRAGGSGDRAGKGDAAHLRSALLAALTSPVRLGRAVAALDPAETAILVRILAAGPDGVRPADLSRTSEYAWGSGRTPEGTRPAVLRLVRAGLVLERDDAKLLVPEEVRRSLRARVQAEIPRVADGWLDGRLPDPAGPGEVVESVARLLATFRHPVPMTRDGALYQRFHVPLLAALGPGSLTGAMADPASAPALGAGRPTFAWEGYGDRLGTFLAILAALGLLRTVQDGRAVATTADAPAFLAGPPEHLFARIALAWLRLLDSLAPGTAFLLEALPPDAWAPLGRVLPDLAQRSLLRSELPALVAWTGYHLGLVSLAWAPKDEIAVRSTPAGAAALAGRSGSSPVSLPGFPPFEETAFVQGSFEILTPPYLHPAAWFDLLLVADPVRIDRASVLRLSEKSFARHADADLAPTQAAELLRRRARGDLPQSVAFTVDTWVRRMQGVSLETRAVLRLDDPAIGERLADVLRAAAFPFEMVTETVWLCPPSAHLWLQEQGAKQGIRVRGERVRLEATWDLEDSGVHPRWFALPWPGPARPLARDLWA